MTDKYKVIKVLAEEILDDKKDLLDTQKILEK